MMRMSVQVELPRLLLWVEALAVTEWHLEISKVISCVYIRNKKKFKKKKNKKKKKKKKKNAGESGKPEIVETNYFKLMKTPEVDLFQYRVDFHPEIEHQGVRKDLVHVHRDILKKYTVYSTEIFCTQPFLCLRYKPIF